MRWPPTSWKTRPANRALARAQLVSPIGVFTCASILTGSPIGGLPLGRADEGISPVLQSRRGRRLSSFSVCITAQVLDVLERESPLPVSTSYICRATVGLGFQNAVCVCSTVSLR
jgi:hypothetical protein